MLQANSCIVDGYYSQSEYRPVREIRHFFLIFYGYDFFIA